MLLWCCYYGMILLHDIVRTLYQYSLKKQCWIKEVCWFPKVTDDAKIATICHSKLIYIKLGNDVMEGLFISSPLRTIVLTKSVYKQAGRHVNACQNSQEQQEFSKPEFTP